MHSLKQRKTVYVHVGNRHCTCFSIHGHDYIITVLVSTLNAVNTVVPVLVFKAVPRVLRVTHLMTHFLNCDGTSSPIGYTQQCML